MKQPAQNNLYKEIKSILDEARQSAYRAVNFTMVIAYWEIGKLIVEDEQKGMAKANYGQALLKELSKKLTKDFGKGFTETNLRYFRQFYISFPPEPKYHALRDESANKSKEEKHHAVRDESGNNAIEQKGHALRDQLKNSLDKPKGQYLPQKSSALRSELPSQNDFSKSSAVRSESATKETNQKRHAVLHAYAEGGLKLFDPGMDGTGNFGIAMPL